MGILHADNQIFAKVSYLIECWSQSDGTVLTDGVVDVDRLRARQCCPSDEMILVLETGERVRVYVASEDSGHAVIEVHDPVSDCVDRCG